MRLVRMVSAANWRNAVGEIVLIVIGILIALAVTSWYEARLDRRNEVLILEQLHETLTEDLQEIESTYDMTRDRERNLLRLLDYLESEEPYTPELGVTFQALFGWRTVRIKTAPFEALKAQSYKAISSAELRYMLIAFYEDQFARLEYNSFLDRDLAIQKIQPYFFEHFVLGVGESTDVDGGRQSWTPKDYAQIRSDAYLANLCRYRADILRRFVLRDYEIATRAMQDILVAIELELAEY